MYDHPQPSTSISTDDIAIAVAVAVAISPPQSHSDFDAARRLPLAHYTKLHTSTGPFHESVATDRRLPARSGGHCPSAKGVCHQAAPREDPWLEEMARCGGWA